MKAFIFQTFFACFTSLGLWVPGMAQEGVERLIKIGGFVYVNKGEYSGFSLHMEMEKAFQKRKFLSSGPRLDYVKIPDFGIIGENLYVGYNLKAYPFFSKRQVPLNGLFVGVEPLMLLNKHEVDRIGNVLGRYGPGLAALLGYQFKLMKNLSLGFEGSMILVQNLNKNSNRFQGYDHKSGRYIYFYANLKLGLKF